MRVLYVDNDDDLRQRYVRNLRSELRKVLNEEIHVEECAEVEDAREVIDQRGSEFSIIICDLLFAPIDRPGAPEEDHEPRGLEVVALASETTSAVVVALSVGNSKRFPFLSDDAEKRGATLVRLKGMIQDGARYGWTGFARDIADKLKATAGPGITRAFIVHGRDPSHYREQVARLIERTTSLEPIILDEQPNKGLSLIEKFRAHARPDGVAIIIMTGDDVAYLKSAGPASSRPRPRQNVILELGYFLGTLPRDRTIVLREEDLEGPSDIEGVSYYDLSGDWKRKLARELHELHVEVDFSRIQ
jgi:hypothetical protein